MATVAAGQSQSGKPAKETVYQSIAGFVVFFVYLLVIKGFLLPLFIIPTGSMAATLNGAHADRMCPNCGWEYALGVEDTGAVQAQMVACPNCRWVQINPARAERGAAREAIINPPLHRKSGDRIVVHGWPYVLGGDFGPRRWDVVVFKVPSDGQTNYIKRLIGLPGEKIEIIDGDIFANDQIQRKPAPMREALWFPYFVQDYRPLHPSNQPQISPPGGYHPRWVAVADKPGWIGLDTREPSVDLVGKERAEARFITTVQGEPAAIITNFYGYNAPYPVNLLAQGDLVPDLRISCEVTFLDGPGYVELSSTKAGERFAAKLFRDGRVLVERQSTGAQTSDEWGRASVTLPSGRPVRFALGNADYRISVEVGDRVVWASGDDYSITPHQAREHARRKQLPRLILAAEDVDARLSHVRIDRDIYYSNMHPAFQGDFPGLSFNAGMGNPITLGPREYFVCGDNSPSSKDSRWWQPGELGAHMRPLYERGEYQAGTITEDQLIGQAFLVYWPGFQKLLPFSLRFGSFDLANVLPDVGRIRWIR